MYYMVHFLSMAVFLFMDLRNDAHIWQHFTFFRFLMKVSWVMEYFIYGNKDHYKHSSLSEETNSENKYMLQQTVEVISFYVHF